MTRGPTRARAIDQARQEQRATIDDEVEIEKVMSYLDEVRGAERQGRSLVELEDEYYILHEVVA